MYRSKEFPFRSAEGRYVQFKTIQLLICRHGVEATVTTTGVGLHKLVLHFKLIRGEERAKQLGRFVADSISPFIRHLPDSDRLKFEFSQTPQGYGIKYNWDLMVTGFHSRDRAHEILDCILKKLLKQFRG